jgi:hypothetical protein
MRFIFVVVHVLDNNWRQEQNELVQQEYAENVSDYVEALQDYHSVHEEGEEENVHDPTGQVVRCNLV